MSLDEKVSVRCAGLDSEELYFIEQEQKRLQALREKASKECSNNYCDEHKYHCFRCGTNSLAEIDHNGIKIDVCVNEGCGAVHLDPGEMEQLAKADIKTLGRVRTAVLAIFK